MTNSRHWRGAALTALLSLILFACAIDEDLQINADGSGTYRIKVTIPKDLSSDFGDLRKSAEKDGFSVVEEGQTEKERFIVLRKDFTEITSLNDGNNRFELTIAEAGWLKREYRLRVSLQSVGFGSFKRHFVVTMPGNVTTTNQGEIDGSRVRWDATNGGSMDITATGYSVPLSRVQLILMLVAALGGVGLLIARRRRSVAPSSACATCHTQLPRDARFCAACGTGASIART
jgi:hypothetical protein